MGPWKSPIPSMSGVKHVVSGPIVFPPSTTPTDALLHILVGQRFFPLFAFSRATLRFQRFCLRAYLLHPHSPAPCCRLEVTRRIRKMQLMRQPEVGPLVPVAGAAAAAAVGATLAAADQQDRGGRGCPGAADFPALHEDDEYRGPHVCMCAKSAT